MRWLLLGMLVGCGVLPGHSILPEWDGVIRAEWHIAQHILTDIVGDKAFTVFPDHFRWQEETEMFACGKDYPAVHGCYAYEQKLITWNINAPTVIRHEAQHAILHKLKDSRWRTFPHGGQE